MATLEDLVERIDWELFRSLEPLSPLMEMHLDRATVLDGNPMLRWSYPVKVSEMLSFPFIPPEREDMPHLHAARDFEDPMDPIRQLDEYNGSNAFYRAKNIGRTAEIESTVAHDAQFAAGQIGEKYGSHCASKIANAVLEWYGDAKMLPNALHHFATALSVAEKLPDNMAKAFFDNYSPLFFDEGLMQTLAEDFKMLSEQSPEYAPYFMNLFFAMSGSANIAQNSPRRVYKSNGQGGTITATTTTAGSPRIFKEFGIDGEAYLAATISSQAELLWDSISGFIPLLVTYGASEHAQRFLQLAPKFVDSFKAGAVLANSMYNYVYKRTMQRETVKRVIQESAWERIEERTHTPEFYPKEEIGKVLAFFENMNHGGHIIGVTPQIMDYSIEAIASGQNFDYLAIFSLSSSLPPKLAKLLYPILDDPRFIQVFKSYTSSDTSLDGVCLSFRKAFSERFGFNAPNFGRNDEERLEALLGFFKDVTVPGVDAAFRQAAQYGTLRESFNHVPEAAKTIELLKMQGYDADFYVASGAEIAKSTHELGELIDWKTNFEALTRRVFGTRAKRMPDLSIPGYQPGRLYMEMRADYNEAVKGNRHAAINLVSRLLEIVSNIPDNLKSRPIVEFHDELSGLHSQIESNSIVQGGSLTARIWARDVPDSLYHNEELACCIFLPDGAYRGESAKFVLDPQTTMIEYFANGQKPRRSVATLYAGKNDCILMDTWEANQSVYSSLGNVKTKKFVLDTLALAALRALPHAERPLLAVHNCSYGRSREFATFLHSSVGREGSIWHEPTFAFEAVSVDDIAIPKLLSQGHHYTDAFGVNKPLVGTIDAYVVDARKYVAQHHLAKG